MARSFLIPVLVLTNSSHISREYGKIIPYFSSCVNRLKPHLRRIWQVIIPYSSSCVNRLKPHLRRIWQDHSLFQFLCQQTQATSQENMARSFLIPVLVLTDSSHISREYGKIVPYSSSCVNRLKPHLRRIWQDHSLFQFLC